MRHLFIIIIVSFFQTFNFTIMAQVQGEYIFSKQEMVAGFYFSADGKFNFFYSYGAVDRTAEGTFTIEGDTVKLKSDKEAGKDFTIIKQQKIGKGYTIQFEDDNKYLLTNIRCSFFTGTEMHDEYTDTSGTIKVDMEHCDKIYVQHLLFPDIVTLIKDETNGNNTFTLTLNPSLSQVSFKDIDLIIKDGKTLKCIPNYFMMVEDIEFEKQ